MLGGAVDRESLEMQALYDVGGFKADPRGEFRGVKGVMADHGTRKILEANLSLARPTASERVLEVGCGMGQLTERLCLQAGEVFAFDLSGKNGHFTLRYRSQERAVVFVADAIRIPLPDEYFDCVVASEVIEHVPEPHRMIEEMKRVTRPGGRICISTPNPYIIAYPHFGLPSFLLHPRRTIQRLRGEVSWDSTIPDYWITPRTLRRWMSEHGLRVLGHHTFMYFSWRGLTWFLCLFSESVLRLKVDKLFQRYIEFADGLVESRIPLLNKLGTRQVILAQKT